MAGQSVLVADNIEEVLGNPDSCQIARRNED